MPSTGDGALLAALPYPGQRTAQALDETARSAPDWVTRTFHAVAVVHPGVQLAPAIGGLVAEELVHGRDTAALRDCRPARFAAPQRAG